MSKKSATRTLTGAEAREMRQRLGLNQTDFWSKVGANQTSASRYENGRKLPKAIQMLLTLAYGSQCEADKALAQLRAKVAA